MGCSTPGLPVHDHLPELAQTCPSCWWCRPTISSSVIPCSSCLQSFPASGSFPMSQLFASGSQSIGASALASGLISFRIDWFDLSVQGTLKSLLQHHSSKASILQSAAFFIGSFGICASKFPFLLIQFSITFSGKKSESWIKHSVVRMHACLLASTPFTAMCL